MYQTVRNVIKQLNKVLSHCHKAKVSHYSLSKKDVILTVEL